MLSMLPNKPLVVDKLIYFYKLIFKKWLFICFLLLMNLLFKNKFRNISDYYKDQDLAKTLRSELEILRDLFK